MISVLSWHVYPRVFGISPHGVGIAVGFFLGGTLMTRYAQRKGISYAAWRELGVPADVLKKAGISRGS